MSITRQANPWQAKLSDRNNGKVEIKTQVINKAQDNLYRNILNNMGRTDSKLVK